MRALVASMCMLLIAASNASAGQAGQAKHARATLQVSIAPAEPLPAHPRTPVRIETLAGDELAQLMLATDAANRDAVKAIAVNICGSTKMAMAACFGALVRVNDFLRHEAPLMEAANKD